ncbi:MAG TPA: xanthine dehydrogenase family protein molybdopterin-binding subunit [Steroidobacteraceae bacterium]|nr:xanthine dehydrogenase family protein molybdopterin-binding subunit [Steroidobacteraceae bacterium]
MSTAMQEVIKNISAVTESVETAGASRRDFLKTGVALTLSIALPQVARAQRVASVVGAPWEANAYVRIAADSSVTVIVKHLEMGQGVYTGLATLVAEELDADWEQMRAEGAPVGPAYGNKLFGGAQGTGGSTSLASSYDLMREAGAKARAMLVGAAAKQWGVPASEITVVKGIVSHAGTKRTATFGQLVGIAAKIPVPTTVKLKDPQSFTLIGKHSARLDSKAKSDGTAIYTQDFKVPGLLTAVVAHPPLFGGKVKSFDATKARAIKGVVDVVKFDTSVTTGVAVLATNFWAAKKGRDALVVQWDDSSAFKQSSADILASYKELAKKPGAVARKDGDVDAAFAKAARTVEAEFEFPFLAHASMEPLNCVVQIRPDGVEVWNGEQFQAIDAAMIGKAAGFPPSKVKINTLYAGGSFGRRANPAADYTMETAAIAKAANTNAPVKLVWTREDDTRAGFYRPMYYHTMKAGLDAQGKIIAWQHRIVGQPIMAGKGIDQSSVEGASNVPYDIPNVLVDLHTTKLGVPVQWWRSVGSTHTAFAVECFLDDVARAVKKDPVQLRRELLAKHPRHLGVLELAVEKAGWGEPAAGKLRGIAVHESFNSFVAELVEATKTADGYKLERVICAVDCGIAVNPKIVAMQMESGIGYGLSAAISGAITLRNGQVEQANFNDYPVLRMNQMPKIEVHIVPSTAAPTGVGEPGTPPIAPALVNALNSGGATFHSLPLSAQKVKIFA